MTEIFKTSLENVYGVKTEPGDCTCYDFFVYKDYDNYSIMPRKSTIRFPQRLNIWDIKAISEEGILSLAEIEKCNPYTLKEVIRIILIIHEGE